MSHSLADGTVLGGRFAIVRPLGGGGWGEVYEARQLDLDRRVAIKILRGGTDTSPEALARFEREARSAAAIGHPNIVQITHFERAPHETPFLVMELFDGVTLAQLIRDRPMSAGKAIPIFAQILSALDAAHGAGIIHRDIKPANVFVIPLAGGADLVKVLDFGIARLDAGAKLTATGTFVGTPRYMPPEQILGREIDARADLYAVGATLHHVLSGKPSIAGRDATAVLEAVIRGDHTPITTACPGIDRALAAIVSRALAADPAARFGSAREMLAALLEVPLVAAPREPLAPRAPSMTRSIMMVLAIGIAIAALGIAGVWALFVRGHAPSTAPRVIATEEPTVLPSSPVAPPSAPVPEISSAPSSSAIPARGAPLTRRFLRGSSALSFNGDGGSPLGSGTVAESRPAIVACLARFSCPGHERILATYQLQVDHGAVKGITRSEGVPCAALDHCIISELHKLTLPVNPDAPTGIIEAAYAFDPVE